MAKHVILKVCGDVDVDLALVPVTPSLGKVVGDRTGNAWRYIEALGGDPLAAIMRALRTVERVLALLLGPAPASQPAT